MNDQQEQKNAMRAEAMRARSLINTLSAEDTERFIRHFMNTLHPAENQIVAAYWPKNREIDTLPLMETLANHNIVCALPVVQKDSRLLKFIAWEEKCDMVQGAYGVSHPALGDNPQWLEPDIFIVPLLAFDRRGYRLGFGGGYYDTTLAYYQAKKGVSAVGVAYAQQATLFNLPVEDHDIRMDWIITPQQVFRYQE